MDRPEVVESARKRQKTEDVPAIDVGTVARVPNPKELEVGIAELVTANIEGIGGILKKRYTDFLVNEIMPSGEVVHLRNTSVPDSMSSTKKEPEQPKQQEEKPAAATEEAAEPEFQVSDTDKASLTGLFGEKSATEIIELHARAMADRKARPSEFGTIAAVVTDRDTRTKMHQIIRGIFKSQLESSADGEGNFSIAAASNRFKRAPQGGRPGRSNGGNRVSWDELGGPYLHFTIFKENKDTMEVISFLARQLKMNAKNFQFAGTKDRRGVTAQRACVLRVQAERLAKLNSTLRGVKLGDFEYRKHGLDLGDLYGNEFIITLRDCQIPGLDMQNPQDTIAKASKVVESSLEKLFEHGYFNYYGLQRFGTFSAGTHSIGIKMLQGDFEGACNAILHYSPHVLAAAQEGEDSTALISRDDKARALGIHLFQTTGNINKALQELPGKFSAETSLIRHLGRAKSDFLGALQSIPRNLRLMYVHAYQSLVWNNAASERWRLHGDKVVEGDLVIVQEHRDKESKKPEAQDTVDADGEVIVIPEGENSANATDDMFTRARALTNEEAASGLYSVFDIVLPLPGFDVIYPSGKMNDFYREFMGSENGGGLDPLNMRRKWKDISLSGSYRKILSRIGGAYSFDVKLYSEEDQQFVKTDLDKLKQTTDDADAVSDTQTGDKLAVVVKFQLGQSQYATMALRELSKGRVQEWKPDMGPGR
ncbi:hypothetical protein N7478_009227 [Penicillium angulare]|uniref:uncharacterized protein n=1 Tax=Penicillium angulare TaxID=116970 RepID=UPI00253F9F88|nr:uncharacterized protein N7478_009227 [Penicillium angulare]KAJ5274102.1 hypothetical protein N7478_009227 [Penicillium angulare]